MFNHCPPVELEELNTETIDGKRHYLTPKGKYISITTLLGSFDKKHLYEWRKRVGDAEANRISAYASSRGTMVHKVCERYLLNEEISNKEYKPHILDSFYSIKPHLNNINNIHYLECPLYSDRLGVAGRSDCIANYNEQLSIIDFKTSSKEKKEEWIENYFLQGAFYASAYYELTGIVIKNIVIIIAVDDGPSQVFEKPVKNYIKLLLHKINLYKEMND